MTPVYLGIDVGTSAVKALLGASYVAFADIGKAEQLAGSITGTESFPAKMRLEIAGLKVNVEFSGDIDLK